MAKKPGLYIKIKTNQDSTHGFVEEMSPDFWAELKKNDEFINFININKQKIVADEIDTITTSLWIGEM